MGKYKLLGETLDDEIGEAFDKTAKILGLGYPGGPEIEAASLNGTLSNFNFKSGRVKTNPLAFSFSGIKTAVLYATKKIETLSDEVVSDIALAFQVAVFTDVCKKIKLALTKTSCRSVYL